MAYKMKGFGGFKSAPLKATKKKMSGPDAVLIEAADFMSKGKLEPVSYIGSAIEGFAKGYQDVSVSQSKTSAIRPKVTKKKTRKSKRDPGGIKKFIKSIFFGNTNTNKKEKIIVGLPKASKVSENN